MSWLEAALRWYAVLAALTWAFVPGVRWLCHRLTDRGVTVARPLAVLAAVYPSWLVASAGWTAFRGEAIVAAAALSSVVGWWFTLRIGSDLRSWLRSLVTAELASAALFAAYIWLRGFTPQILGTEKPMDIAFLASSMRAVAMPPPDPWFAGEPINYYYLGYLLHGAVGRLAGVPPEIAFNLALATIFSTTVVAAFGVAWNIVSPSFGRALAIASGGTAAFVLAIAGNLYAPIRLVQDAPATVAAWWWDSVQGIGWRASRIVCDGPRVSNQCPAPATETINEFPFFSFLLGDLHPHLMALPYSIVAIGLAWSVWQWHDGVGEQTAGAHWLRSALIGVAIGALYPLNAWDVPTYLFLAAIAVWVGAASSLRSAVMSLIVLATSAVIAWLPFITAYVPPSADAPRSGAAMVPGVSTVLSAISLHLGERTSLGEYLTIFGPQYAFGVALVATVWRQANPDGASDDLSTAGVVSAATIVPGVILSAPVIPLCGVPLALALIRLRRSALAPASAFALTLFALAWALSIGVELVYIRDAFDDRMNTLFKFYYQAWTLYAVASAVSFAVLWRSAWMAWRRTVLAGAMVAVLVAALAYPIVASYQWTEGFAAWQGLDGLAYGSETAPDEVSAIRWLAAHASPGDVVLEAAGCSYIPSGRLPFNRVSAFAGLPTIVGWGNHERQWRAGQPDLIADIPTRQSDVARMYAEPAGALAERYGVQWIFVGDYESGDWRAECESAGPYEGIAAASFPGPGWEEAFRSGDTRLYRRTSS